MDVCVVAGNLLQKGSTLSYLGYSKKEEEEVVSHDEREEGSWVTGRCIYMCV